MNLREVYEQQKNFWAGVILVSLLFLALFFSYQNKAKKVPSSGMVLYATYHRADGLNVGAPIRLAGTQVGRVSATKLDEHFQVTATLTFTKKVDLPTDTAAIIETDGLVGNKFIELLAGGDEEMMQNGDHFLYTQDVLLLDELLGRFIEWMRIKKGVMETELIKGENE